MRVKGVSPDGKKAVEFESELIGRELIDRMVNFDLSEDDIRKRIDRLAVSADVKSLLYSLAKASIAIGAQVVRIGRKVIDYVCMLVKEFPKVTFFALLGAIAGFLVATIPILGVVLGPIVTPIAIAVGAAFGVLEDILDQALKRKITEFHAQFAPLREPHEGQSNRLVRWRQRSRVRTAQVQASIGYRRGCVHEPACQEGRVRGVGRLWGGNVCSGYREILRCRLSSFSVVGRPVGDRNRDGDDACGVGCRRSSRCWRCLDRHYALCARTRRCTRQNGTGIHQYPARHNRPGLIRLDGTAGTEGCAVDGEIDHAEAQAIERWFVREWGYDPSFVQKGLAFFDSRLDEVRIADIATALPLQAREPGLQLSRDDSRGGALPEGGH